MTFTETFTTIVEKLPLGETAQINHVFGDTQVPTKRPNVITLQVVDIPSKPDFEEYEKLIASTIPGMLTLSIRKMTREETSAYTNQVLNSYTKSETILADAPDILLTIAITIQTWSDSSEAAEIYAADIANILLDTTLYRTEQDVMLSTGIMLPIIQSYI